VHSLSRTVSGLLPRRTVLCILTESPSRPCAVFVCLLAQELMSIFKISTTADAAKTNEDARKAFARLLDSKVGDTCR
jgi:hypothetical protein